MGVRFRLGGGLSAGRSGLRFNSRSFGVGLSGVRLNAGPVRIWAPLGRRRSSAPTTPVALTPKEAQQAACPHAHVTSHLDHAGKNPYRLCQDCHKFFF